MLRSDFTKRLREIYDRAILIVASKNQDYAKDEDAFANFKMASLVGVDDRSAVLVRISDKLARVVNLLDKENVVKDETIEDTIVDCINYLAILLCMIEERKKNI